MKNHTTSNFAQTWVTAHCDIATHKTSARPKQKMFFRVQSTRLADPFEPLYSSLAQSAEELGHW